jgi:hypothetical protein
LKSGQINVDASVPCGESLCEFTVPPRFIPSQQIVFTVEYGKDNSIDGPELQGEGSDFTGFR